MPYSSCCFVGGLGAGKILLEDLLLRAALVCHGSCALLTESHAVSPTTTMKEEVIALLAYFEPGAGNPIPSKSLAHGELEGLGGDCRCVEAERDCAA